MIRWLSLLLALTLAPLALAAIDTYEFETEAQREQFYKVSSELRCPKCQNQNIADSDAPIAMDLRRQVYPMFTEGTGDAPTGDVSVRRCSDVAPYTPSLSTA